MLRYLILLVSLHSFSQIHFTPKFADSLTQNANAIVQLNEVVVKIESQQKMSILKKRIITIFNKEGMGCIDAFAHYDKVTSIDNIDAKVFSLFGKELKHIRKKDFRDVAAVDGFSVFSDSRVKYLDYTPTEFPFTLELNIEITTSNTAFIPSWQPIEEYYMSIEKSTFSIEFPSNLGFKKKEINFGDFKIKSEVTSNKVSYEIKNLVAQKPEYLTKSNYFPKVIFGLESFNLEGVDGSAKTWADFGNWYSEKLISNTTELTEETKNTIRELVKNETNNIDKAKKIYQYMQNKTRYVSIQVGIGGWKPMLAKDVDRLGYGDCKALSNYMRAMLQVVGIESYNTILYGNRNILDIDSDFVSMQGNHVILCIPDNNQYHWLECTSQDSPFGFNAFFTDDRNVLIIKPQGAEIVHTKTYDENTNTQISKGAYSIDKEGNILTNVIIKSKGTQYAQKQHLEKEQPIEVEKHYKEEWATIGGLKIIENTFSNNKDNIEFEEKVKFEAPNYGKMTGNTMIFPVNVFNQIDSNLKRIRNRKTPFEIQRGFLDTDEIEINLPEGFTIEFLPKNETLNTKFGNYSIEFLKKKRTKNNL